jgi:hypothetical protein
MSLNDARLAPLKRIVSPANDVTRKKQVEDVSLLKPNKYTFKIVFAIMEHTGGRVGHYPFSSSFCLQHGYKEKEKNIAPP